MPSSRLPALLAVFSLGATALLAQGAPPAQAPAIPEPGQKKPTFSVQVNAVTMDVLAQDQEGRFVPDLTKDEFEIYEDGVKQTLASLTVSHGGRVTNVLTAAPPPAPEGLILPTPASTVQNGSSGRVFLFFVDDLHLQVEETSRVRALVRQMGAELLHDGDLFGILSSGSSAIQVDMTYDHARLDEAVSKIVGHGLPPNDIIQNGQGMWGVRELRSQVQVAFSTIHDAVLDLAKMHDRRKLIVWVTDGFDFTPFQESRLGQGNPNNFFLQNFQNFQRSNTVNEDGSHQQVLDRMVEAQKQNETFSDADLAAALRQLTDEANRANATIYTIDPRGLVSGQQIDQQVNPTEWHDYVVKEQDSMRDLAARTGGLAVVDDNDFTGALKRIDAEASDYYILGYYSNSPNPNARHKIEVRVTRPGVRAQSRSEYVPPGSSGK